MNAILWTLLFVSISASLAWVVTRSHRRLPRTPDVILRSMHKQVLRNLNEFLVDQDFTDDDRFWAASGHFEGIRLRRQNAASLVQLCQMLKRDSYLEEEELEYATSRVLAISFFSALAYPEALLRHVAPQMPHACARLVAVLYAQLEAFVVRTCQENAPHLLPGLRAVL